jgi:alcohol dehydrogenase
MKDYWGIGKATKPMLPFVAIPTTAGTGSECQSFALISDAITHAKMACGDKKAAASLALLDPELTVTQPAMVTRHTGIDAITHALESAVSTKSSPLSRNYSLAAFALLAAGFPVVLQDPANLLARSQMLLGAALAGVAIENSMLGAAHACANPLTANFHVVHGEAVGVMMPAVLKMNAFSVEAAQIYRSLTNCLGLNTSDLSDWFRSLLDQAQLPQKLSHWGITEMNLDLLASQAATQWTGTFNPIKVDEFILRALYKQTL